MALPFTNISSATLRLSSKTWVKPCSTLRGVPRPIGRRSFSVSQIWQLKTTEMNDELLSSLKVNQNRLMEDIHYTCQWGLGERWGSAPTETGMSRLSLSDTDKDARDWFVEATQALGCHTTVDSMGNIFAIRPGLRNDKPPTFVGSHLDTQPTGGRYDGILGVTAGVEMLKVLSENWVETEYPVGVVNWTNEEGARFPISMVSSGVWAGAIPEQTAHNLKEVHPGTATMASELARIGYLGNVPCIHQSIPMAAHFELHIEQGPILESTNKKIGIVKGVQAYRWFTVSVKGRDTHTGTTDLKRRADALLTSSKLILHSHKLATKHSALASTGILNLKPGSTNTVPGQVTFSLDIRASKDSVVQGLEEAIRTDFPKIAAGENILNAQEDCTPSLPTSVTITQDSDSPAVNFHPDCISAVTDAANSALGPEAPSLTEEMVSGAGHDSVYTNRRCPTSMIFVPCREGISHNPAEFCKPEDCAMGAQVLMQAVLRFDKMRAERRVSWKQEGYHM